MTRRDELIRELKQSVKVARRVTDFPMPFEPEPPDIIFYRIHIFLTFFGRISVIESQVTLPTVLSRNGKIQAD